MAVINWLHLTDLHQGLNSQGWLWPSVRQEFFRDLEVLHRKCGPWDVVIFTGDLTNTGAVEEFQKLDETLSEIWEKLRQLGSSPVLLPVPGNHDLLRLPVPDLDIKAITGLWNQDQEIRRVFWESDSNSYREPINKAFANFMEWRNSSPLIPKADFTSGTIPGDFSATITRGALKLGVIGLNSAFLQLTGGDYQGRLDLDVRQLHAACHGDAVKWVNNHHLVLLLTHHPFNWFYPQSQEAYKAEIYPPGRFLLHLFGHMHEAASQSIRIGGAATQRYLQGASLFGLETWGDGRTLRKHGYSAGRVRVEGGEGLLQIWPRKMDMLQAGHRKMVPDQSFDLDDDDGSIKEPFSVTTPLASASPGAAPPDPPTVKPSDRPEKPGTNVSYHPSNPYFFIPYAAKGAQLIGRDHTLESARRQLTTGSRSSIGQTIAFSGLGGLGKTQLAAEYAHNFKGDYPDGVIWINADQVIDAQLIEISDKAKWIAPESEHKDKLAVASQRLRSFPNCLIIFDNVESYKAIEEYVESLHPDCHILATSQNELIGFTPIPLDLLDEDNSYKLLLQVAGRNPDIQSEKEAALEIVKTLGGLPLALELAGAYLRYRSAIGWRQYLELLKDNLRAAFPGKLSQVSFTKHQADLYSTLKINEEILNEEPRLRDILDLLTWSGSAPMGKDLLCSLLGVKGFTELTNAVGLGIALRLLQQTPKTESYSIHRLVRKVRRDEVPIATKTEWVRDICARLGDWFEKRREDYAELLSFEAEIDHLQAWLTHATQYAAEHASRLTWLQGYPPYHRGRYHQAREWVEKAFDLLKLAGENDDKLKAHLLNDLGSTCSALGEYKKSLDYHEDSLVIRLELLGQDHPETATSYSNVGTAFGSLGDYKQQLEYAQKSLQIRLRILGEDHSKTATAYNNVGAAFGNLGDHKQELEHAKKSLQIRLRLFGEDHPETATAYGNAGVAFGNSGDYKQQLEYAQKSLQIRLRLFGEGHPHTALSYNNLGIAYQDQGDIKQSLDYRRRALALMKNLYGFEHPGTIEIAKSIVIQLVNLNRSPEAFRILDEFLNKVPKGHSMYASLTGLDRELKSKVSRDGFRQLSSKNKAKKKKKR
jgi:tetratricopeptide (TPR) repeat protein